MQKKLITIILLIFSITIIQAKEQKIGYVDLYGVYNQCPDKIEAEQQFEQERTQWERELVEKEDEIQRLKDEYLNLPPVVTEQRKEEKKALIEKKENEYYDFAEEIRNKALRRQAELLEPISQKIVNAINKIAEENNFDMIINSQEGECVLYAKEELDITQQVIDILIEKKDED